MLTAFHGKCDRCGHDHGYPQLRTVGSHYVFTLHIKGREVAPLICVFDEPPTKQMILRGLNTGPFDKLDQEDAVEAIKVLSHIDLSPTLLKHRLDELEKDKKWVAIKSHFPDGTVFVISRIRTTH